MPIYEYQCEKCHHHLEALQKFSDKPLRECPECGKHTLKRLMSAPMFRLAGSGWYETDFKSDKENKRNLVEKEKGEAPAAAAATTTTTESAPEKPAAPAKVPATKESAPSESASSKRRTVTRPAPVAKPVVKARPPTAAKPAARKVAVRKR
jgi:putative FmdB family regulatory protein